MKAGARAPLYVLTALLAAATACSSLDDQLQQHRKKIESLGATTGTIGDAWLSGSVSPAYARTALERTRQLVEQERAALASAPDALADPRGAQLSQAAERLSRLLADLTVDVRHADRASARAHLGGIPILPADRP